MLSFRIQEDAQLTEEQAREVLDRAKALSLAPDTFIDQEARRLGFTENGRLRKRTEILVLIALDELVLAGLVTRVEDGYVKIESTSVH